MENGAGPPEYTVATSGISDIPAPPYPGPPLEPSVMLKQPGAEQHPQGSPQHVAQQYQQPVAQQYQQPVAQQYQQPVAQQYQQPVAQQYQQPVAQQYLQPVAQQYQQSVAQQYPQPGQQPVMQYVPTQNQPSQQVMVIQQKPTDAPGSMICPHCKNTVVTSVEHKVGLLTLVIFGVLCLLICWPCSWIPFVLNSCKDVQHSCPQCNNVLHIYKRM